MPRFLNKGMLIICILALLAPFSTGFTIFPAKYASTGKQIVLMLDDKTSKFTSVRIQGYDQNNQWKTWSKQDSVGFMLAYTKNWWWAENFVQIDFVIQDNQSRQSYAKTCLIDVLEQPKDSPRVEIIYSKTKGCIGGNIGNAQDPVQKGIKPVRDAFKTTKSYLSDFQMDVFMDILNKELTVISCVGGVALAFQTGGYSYALAKVTVTTACEKTGELILKQFFTKP
jgi:hypothetical protein